jgi:hypothetical protein
MIESEGVIMWESEEARKMRRELEEAAEKIKAEKEAKEKAWSMGAAYGGNPVVATWPSKEMVLLERCIGTMGDLVTGDMHLPPDVVDNLLKVYSAIRASITRNY